MAAHTPVPDLALSPLFTKRRRVIIACKLCRKRKIRCLTTEDSPVLPCERCAAKGLKCEYITVSDQREHAARSNDRHGVRASRGSSGSTTPSQGGSPEIQPARWQSTSPLLQTLRVDHSPRSADFKSIAFPMGDSYYYPPYPRRNTAPPVTHYDRSTYPPTGTYGDTQPESVYRDSTRTLAPLGFPAYNADYAHDGYKAPEYHSTCDICPPGSCTCSWRRY